MSDVKPSGPLWAVTNNEGTITTPFLVAKHGPYNTPARVIPGHGRVVPLELVEAIEKARISPAPTANEYYLRLDAAIRAAIEGAL